MSRLSVCIPTWNAAPWLAGTVSGLLAQEGCELEIVVCDDASEDETLDIATGFDDPRIRVVPHERRLGLAGNWNRALAEARGELACLFGQDDVAYPGWATTLCGLFDRHPDIALAFGRRDFLFDDDESRSAMGDYFRSEYPGYLAPFYDRVDELIPADVMRAEAMRLGFEVNLIGEPSFVVVRRDHPAVATGFDPRLSQLIDWEFFTRFFVDGPVAHTERVVGAHRLHSASASYSNLHDASHHREYSLVLEVVQERFGRALSWWEGVEIRRRLKRARRLVARSDGARSAAGTGTGC